MEELMAMARLLCLLTPLFLLLAAILPRGELRGYARFVFALIEMGVLLQPILGLIGSLN